MKEIIIELIKIRMYLTEKISGGGNHANMLSLRDIYNPHIEKVDELIKLFKNYE